MYRFGLGAALTALLCFSGLANEVPAHHGDGVFVNPYAPDRSVSFFKVARSRFFSGEWASYDPERDFVQTTTPRLANGDEGVATVTWVGHSTVLLQVDGVNVLTDPIFSTFASPVSFAGPKRITEPALTRDELPPIHAVIISHDHYDHLDLRSIDDLGEEPIYFVPLGIGKWLERRGISSDRIRVMDWWDKEVLRVGDVDVEFTATPSQHFSGRSLTNRNGTLWAAWSIQWPSFHVWFGGDTGYNDVQFVETRRRLPPIDFGIIPIGAYKPREFMKLIHVDPREALQIHLDIGATASMGMHWGTFVLAGEGVMAPLEDLAAARLEAEIDVEEFAAWAIGETRVFPLEMGTRESYPARRAAAD